MNQPFPEKESGMGVGQNPADPSHPQAGDLPKPLPGSLLKAIPEGKAPCGLSAELCIEKPPGKTDPTPNPSPSPPERDPCVQTQEPGWDSRPLPANPLGFLHFRAPFLSSLKIRRDFFFPALRDLSRPSLLAHP